MIVNLTSNLHAQIIRRNELEQRRDNGIAIEASYQKPQKFASCCRKPQPAFTSFNLDLRMTRIAEAVRQLRVINNKLKESREKFMSQYRQIREFDWIEKLVQELKSFLEPAWASYVIVQIQPHFELLNLVEKLPEVTVQGGTLAPLRQRLESASSKLPQRTSHLTQFDADLQTLQSSLANLSGLSSEVTEFLHRIQKGTASITDLTDKVLAWCRENERAGAFKISFGRP